MDVCVICVPCSYYVYLLCKLILWKKIPFISQSSGFLDWADMNKGCCPLVVARACLSFLAFDNQLTDTSSVKQLTVFVPACLPSISGACYVICTGSMLVLQQWRGGYRQKDPTQLRRAWLGRACVSCRSHVSPSGCDTEKRERSREVVDHKQAQL